MASAFALAPVIEEADSQGLYRFSVAQYQQMIETGLLTEEDPVELLDGRIVEKLPRKPPHDVVLVLIQDLFRELVSKSWITRVQSAITTRTSQPEPDLAIAKGPARRYVRQHPTARDLAMVVEVSDKSLIRDRTLKRRAYAQARIPVYWIVNLVDEQVEVHDDPRGERAATYRRVVIYGRDERVPVVIDGKSIGHVLVSEMLP
jgi:Uma2 family endonuclease